VGLTSSGTFTQADVRQEGYDNGTYISVRFVHQFNGIPVAAPVPGSEVRVGDRGAVTGFTIWERTVEESWDIPLKSSSTMYEELRKGNGYYTLPPYTARVVISRVSLAYWLDTTSGKQDYLLPVYEINGECLDDAGNFLGNFNGWIEAAK